MDSKNDNKSFKPETLEGYETYYAVKGTSLNNGCGFYIKEGVHFKSRENLKVVNNDKEDGCWIELSNENSSKIIFTDCLILLF